MRQIIGTFSQLERGRITERMHAGRTAKRDSGNYAGGRPCLGYRAQNGELIVEPSEVAILKRIRSLRTGRHSYSEIARRLNSEGFKSKLGKKFYHGSVKYILTCRTQKGFVRYGLEVKGRHAAIT
jgi:site-specific DNA recombinase